MDPDDPARNKADSLVLNMTHLGNNVKPGKFVIPRTTGQRPSLHLRQWSREEG